MTADTSFGFGTPFAEQLAFFRQKLNLPSARWDDIVKSAHDKGFIVAGAGKADLLDDLRRAVDKAVSQGMGLQEFRKDFDQIVFNRGWTGWTGEGTKGGIAWRTKVIYQTNMATSYAAGRWQQLNDPDLLKLRPYWRYHHADGVMHPRPLHQAWNGLTLPHDHPFWQTHLPPNGWGCHCYISAVDGEEYARAQAAGKGEPPAGWDAIDPKTGAPVGIDKGFDYAPGATWHPDLDKYPQAIARQIVQANLSDGVFERWVNKINQSVAAELATGDYLGMDSGATLSALRVKLGESGAMPLAIIDDETRLLLGADTQTLLVSDYDLIKQAVSRKGEFDALDYLSVQGVLDGNPYLAAQGNGRFVLIPAGRKVPVAVIHKTGDGKELYLKSYRTGFGPEEIARSRKKDEVLRDVM